MQPERDVKQVSLEESRQTLETLMGNLPGMAYRCRLDEGWTMEFVSQGAQALTGYTADELCQNRLVTFESLIHRQDSHRVRAEVMRAVQDDRKFQISYRIHSRDGTEKWVWEQGCAVERQGRRVLEGFITDITEIKRMEGIVQANAAQANALLVAAARLNAQLDLNTVLHTVCEEAVRAVNAVAGAIFLYDHNERAYLPRAGHGIAQQDLQRFRPITREIYDYYDARFEFPRYMPDLLANEDVANRDFYRQAGIRSAAVGDVRRNGQLIGLLITYFGDAPSTQPRSRLELLRGLSDLAAQAISNARYYDQAQRRLRRLEALRAIDGAIVGRGDLDEALHLVIQQVQEHLEVDAVAIFLFNPANRCLEYAAGTGFHDQAISKTSFAVTEGIIGRTAGKALLQLDLSAANLGEPDNFLADESFAAYVGLALRTEERLSGVLALFHRRPLSLSDESVTFLDSLAVQCAIAIDNANLLRKTRRLLQRTQLQANQIRQIVDSVPEGVVLLDRDGRILLANPIGDDYLKTLGGVTVGQTLTHLGGKPLGGLLETASAQSGWQEIHAEQLQLIFEVAFEPLRRGPRAGGWVMVLIDTTEERERQKRQQMQERLATVGQLAAGIAHDFNNILGVITLYTEMLLATLTLDEAQHERLTVVNQQAQQASALIRQILDFSRQSVIERRPVELKGFLKEVVQLLDRTLPENIHVDLFLDEHRSYIVSADLTRLQQVLMNLAVNARDAMPGGGRLRIAMRAAKYDDDAPLPDMAPGPWVVLSVADTGHGIREADLSRIFEPFFTTKERGEGTGLGLAQVYGIIQQHEGHIDVTSSAGKGSIFTIYLPTPITRAAAPERVSEELLPRGNGEVILIVEDNPVIQHALHEILLLLNYHVLLADDGEQALDLLRQHVHDVSLVISDLVMPRMGGAGLHGKLRLLYPELSMVVMTGYPLGMQSRELLEHGDLFWVQKPFSVGTIAETVSSALQA